MLHFYVSCLSEVPIFHPVDWLFMPIFHPVDWLFKTIWLESWCRKQFCCYD